MSKNHILYFTDKFGISAGYEPAFGRMLTRVGLRRANVMTTTIYNLVANPLKKLKANAKVWHFDPDKLDEIRAAFHAKIRAVKPKMVVVSCPAILGVLTNGDTGPATIAKMRGGVYHVSVAGIPDSIPIIVTYPITAIHRNIDERLIENAEDGTTDGQEPYRVQQGATILNWDWAKISRFFFDKQNRLPEFRYSIVRNLYDAEHAKQYLESCRLIGTDIETGNYPPQITCVGFTGVKPDGRVHSFVFPFYDAFAENGAFFESEEEHMAVWAIVRYILDSPAIKAMHNGAYDCTYFVRDQIPPRNFFIDTMAMWWSRFMELPKTLDFVSSILLDNYQYWKDDIKGVDDVKGQVGRKEFSMERYWRYNALDCYMTAMNALMMLNMFQNDSMVKHNYRRALMRIYSGLQMSMRGVKADFKRRDQHKTKLEKQRDEATAILRFMIDEPDFNINSPAQKESLLYDVFGVPRMDERGRKLGPASKKSASAGKIPLKLARQEHPIFKRVIDQLEAAMEPSKQISNVCNMFLATRRFRTAYNACGTETMRFSSKKSNLWDGGNSQNIRKKMRDWLVADPNHVFLDIDYSQSDDVFMAYESQDPEKIKVVESGMDGHAVNGELFFKVPYQEIVDGKKADDPRIVHPITGIRQLAKRTVHGANFQMAAYTLYVTMGRDSVVAAAKYAGFNDADLWSTEQLVKFCGALDSVYRRKYKRLTRKEYYAEIADQLRRTRVIVNAFGDSRLFLGDPNDNGTQREATAFVGQSDTAGNMNRVMEEIDWGYIPKEFRDGANPCANDRPLRMSYDSHGIAFMLQVHDNFVTSLNLEHPRWMEAANNLLRVMERPVIIHGREVVIRAEAEMSIRWSHNTIPWGGDVKHLPDIVNELQKGFK